MLRVAVHLLLAFVLCLNGFLTPVAMAQHADVPLAETAMADHAGSCHESAPADPTAASVDQAASHGDGQHDSSCCKHGHCICGCVVAAHVPASYLPAPRVADVRTALPVSLHVADARYAVALRPPIA